MNSLPTGRSPTDLFTASWSDTLTAVADVVSHVQSVAVNALQHSFEAAKSACVADDGRQLYPTSLTCCGSYSGTAFVSAAADSQFVSFCNAIGRLLASGTISRPPSLTPEPQETPIAHSQPAKVGVFCSVAVFPDMLSQIIVSL